MTCYVLQEDTARMFYTGCRMRTIQDVFDRDSPRLFGVMRDRMFQLMHIFVPCSLRNRGIGTMLLHKMAQHLRDLGCRCIELDDMSERHRQNTNIYVRSGFVYRQKVGPEMTGSPIRILELTSKSLTRRQISCPAAQLSCVEPL